MLSPTQEAGLVEFVIKDFGQKLNRDQFTSYCLYLFEDIAGLESLNDEESRTIINRVWSMYEQR